MTAASEIEGVKKKPQVGSRKKGFVLMFSHAPLPMSSSKQKRPSVVLSPLHAHTDHILSLHPTAAPILHLIQQRCESLRLAQFQANWQLQKHACVKHMQEMANAWIRHW